MLAAVTRHDGNKYVTSSQINAAPGITFLWVKGIPLGLYAPAILPLCIIFCITSIETVGDVSATEEASFINTEGPKHDKRIRGALLNDGEGAGQDGAGRGMDSLSWHSTCRPCCCHAAWHRACSFCLPPCLPSPALMPPCMLPPPPLLLLLSLVC